MTTWMCRRLSGVIRYKGREIPVIEELSVSSGQKSFVGIRCRKGGQGMRYLLAEDYYDDNRGLRSRRFVHYCVPYSTFCYLCYLWHVPLIEDADDESLWFNIIWCFCEAAAQAICGKIVFIDRYLQRDPQWVGQRMTKIVTSVASCDDEKCEENGNQLKRDSFSG